MSDTRLNRIDEAMQRCVDTTPIPGIVTLLYRCGVLGPEGEPMRTDAIFRIYSMTKPIVSSALLTLYEEGAFQLADPVARFIPGFADVRVYAGPASATLQATRTVAPRRRVTIHDLLTHTAGLTYPWMEYGPVEELYRRHVSHLSDQPLADLVQQLTARLRLWTRGAGAARSHDQPPCGFGRRIRLGRGRQHLLLDRSGRGIHRHLPGADQTGRLLPRGRGVPRARLSCAGRVGGDPRPPSASNHAAQAAGAHSRARISPNSCSSFSQPSPPSVERNT